VAKPTSNTVSKTKETSGKRSLITQSVVLPATAEQLYTIYMDPALHSAAIGAPVKISEKPGTLFSAFGGDLSGTTLSVVAPRLIVQSWRSNNFHDTDPDSTLILSFVGKGKKGQIDLIHIDVPEQDYEGVKDGWETYYWASWREYLARK
jgi:activator of HSP90 ATPase